MTERLEPVIHLTIEGKGYDGDEWNAGTGDPGTVVLFPENARAAVEALRVYLGERLKYHTAMVSMRVGELDFTVPNQPDDVACKSLLEQLESATETARCLHQLAPWDYDEDDGDEPDEPSPEPESSEPVGPRVAANRD